MSGPTNAVAEPMSAGEPPPPGAASAAGTHVALDALCAALACTVAGRVVQPHPCQPPTLRVVDPADPDRSELVHMVDADDGQLSFAWPWARIGPIEDLDEAADDITLLGLAGAVRLAPALLRHLGRHASRPARRGGPPIPGDERQHLVTPGGHYRTDDDAPDQDRP